VEDLCRNGAFFPIQILLRHWISAMKRHEDRLLLYLFAALAEDVVMYKFDLEQR